MRKFKTLLLCTAAILLAFSACKKDRNKGPKGTREELTKDSIFLYAEQTYLWNESLPSYEEFNPRSFTNLNAEVAAFKEYAPLDKYSFIDDGTVSDELGGQGGDFGFSVNFNNNPDDLRVTYVYPGSPADATSLKRTDKIIKINGRAGLSGFNNDDINFIVNAVWGSGKTVTLTIQNPDNSTKDISITRGSYSIKPILFSNVITRGSKKVGYFVLNSFVQISGADNTPTAFKSQLDDLFTYFQNENINELIVDLRYNGGGSVETADYIANYLAPAGTTGIMHIDYYNSTMQANQAAILKNQKFVFDGKLYSYFDFDYSTSSSIARSDFDKKGTLNLSRIYFIVSGATASASELLINSLKPVLSGGVQLIGQKTVGKPVGFFPIHIDKYDLYIPQFQTKNRNGEGNYFDGMAVNKADNEDVSKPFGDETERYLAYALYHIQNGNYNISFVSKAKGSKMSAQQTEKASQLFNRTHSKGMIKRVR